MLNGKTIVVTGAASGIGQETARVLRSLGARVIGIDRHEWDRSNVDAAHQADLSDPDSVDAVADALPSGLDGLCNVAGLPPTAAPEQVLKVNVLGLKRLTLRLIDKLADGASITHVGSLAGFEWEKSLDAIQAFHDVGFSDVAAFCKAHAIEGARSYFFSKEYLTVWTYMNRWTWRERQIRMNIVSPGPVETPIFKDFKATLGARVEEDMRIMDRPATPADIAPVIAFLQSDGSRWLRGANLAADGGMSSHLMLAKAGVLASA